MDDILNDLEQRLNITIKSEDITNYTDGASDAKVFSINEKYLVKVVDDLTLRSQIAFLEFYKGIAGLQRVITYNKELKYICFEFIKGKKIKEVKEVKDTDIIKQIKNIVKQYKKYDDNAYGYLYDNEGKSWVEFLEDEINYAKPKLKDYDVETSILDKCLQTISKYNVEKYLIHGDLGTHNFLFDDNGKIMIIDPMPVVGDWLYDFYYAVLSSKKIFMNTEMDSIIQAFDGDYTYQISLFTIVLFIRLSRAYVYDKENFETYLNAYMQICQRNWQFM